MANDNPMVGRLRTDTKKRRGLLFLANPGFKALVNLLIRISNQLAHASGYVMEKPITSMTGNVLEIAIACMV